MPNVQPTVYYKDNRFLVTSVKARSPWKTYKTSKIEKVNLRRDPYFISLAFLVMLLFATMQLGSYLPRGVYFLILLAGAATYVSKSLGVLFVTSKAVSELAFIGDYGTLSQVRDAIEKAMHQENEDGDVTHGEEDEDDDE